MRKELSIACGNLLAIACVAAELDTAGVRGPSEPVAAPSDVGDLCLDVGTSARACWGVAVHGSACMAGSCLVARPASRAVPGPLRCSGQRAARRCELRSNRAGPFVCEAAVCTQAHPRAPDAGEWLCVEIDGVVYCRSTGDAAGIEPGPRDASFVCGARRGHRDEEICVDFSPDPPPELAPFRCRFDYARGAAVRVCTASDAPRVGAPCGEGKRCPEDARCIGGMCLPPRPEPACWFDADCGDGRRCRWGSCLARR